MPFSGKHSARARADHASKVLGRRFPPLKRVRRFPVSTAGGSPSSTRKLPRMPCRCPSGNPETVGAMLFRRRFHRIKIAINKKVVLMLLDCVCNVKNLYTVFIACSISAGFVPISAICAGRIVPLPASPLLSQGATGLSLLETGAGSYLLKKPSSHLQIVSALWRTIFS